MKLYKFIFKLVNNMIVQCDCRHFFILYFLPFSVLQVVGQLSLINTKYCHSVIEFVKSEHKIVITLLRLRM
jgi:hypothetical protein